MNPALSYIIADDDELYRQLTVQQMSLVPGTNCLAVCEDAFSTIQQLQTITPDLLVLDIEMPGLTGIELAKSLKQLPLIIFISSHSKYAVDAFEVDAIDYLVKPVSQERLVRAVEKARTLASMKANTPATEAFQVKDDGSFFIRDKNKFVKIACNDVLYIESLGDFVTIYLQNGTKQIALVSLKNLEQQLPTQQFIRISRTHIVHKQKVTAIDQETVHIQLIQLRIGKTYSEAVLQAVIGSAAIKRFI